MGRSLNADVLCLTELDCFPQFREVLSNEGYDAVFQGRPGKGDGCGIFWRRDMLEAKSPCHHIVYGEPAQDRIALVQVLQHRQTGKDVLVLSTHLHWDQQTGHQVSEAKELMSLISDISAEVASSSSVEPAVVVCGDLNSL